jgi:hypothetical protein
VIMCLMTGAHVRTIWLELWYTPQHPVMQGLHGSELRRSGLGCEYRCTSSLASEKLPSWPIKTSPVAHRLMRGKYTGRYTARIPAYICSPDSPAGSRTPRYLDVIPRDHGEPHPSILKACSHIGRWLLKKERSHWQMLK